MRSVPPQHQTDPANMPGQTVNPIPKDHVFNHDMMDDMGDEAVYRRMHPLPKPGTVGEYARRKSDNPIVDKFNADLDAIHNHAGMPVSEGEAFCSRIMR